jgi:hypothetical protein
MATKSLFKTLLASFAGFLICYIVFGLFYGTIESWIGQQAGSEQFYNLLRGDTATYEILKASSVILVAIILLPLIHYVKLFLLNIHGNFSNKYTLPFLFMIVGFLISILLINSEADFSYISLPPILFYFFLTGYLYESYKVGDFSFTLALDLILISLFYSCFNVSFDIYTITIDQLSELSILANLVIGFVFSLIRTFSLLVSIYLLKRSYNFSLKGKLKNA